MPLRRLNDGDGSTSVSSGRAQAHHIMPESGWVSYLIHGPADVARVVALFRLNYDRPWAARSV